MFYVSWRLWEAHLYVFYVSGWFIAHAARRPADPVNRYPYFILRKSTTSFVFARPKGALRLSARLIPNRFSDPESMILSRNDHLIPTRLSYPEAMIFSRITSVTDEEREE